MSWRNNDVSKGKNPVNMKRMDINVTQTAVTSATTGANVVLLNPIRYGNGDNNRIGRLVSLHSLRWKGYLGLTGTTNTGIDYVRIAIVYDRGTSYQAAPAQSDIFQDLDHTGAVTNTVISDTNRNNARRFKILDIIRLVLPPQSATNFNDQTGQSSDMQFYHFDWFINLQGLQTTYNQATGAVTSANIESGAIFLVPMGLHAAASQAYNLNWGATLKYQG